MNTSVIDLFCGAGGLTRGLEDEGLSVRVGFDIDPACQFPYEANNKARFIEGDISKLSALALSSYWEDATVRVLAGCAPCQPFSNYTQGKSDEEDSRWRLLLAFKRLVESTAPDIVTMENVPDLTRHKVYDRFVKALRKANYFVKEYIVNCSEYGVPQSRKRLVLMASQIGPINLLTPKEFGERATTVRDAIRSLPPITHGECHAQDSLHRSSRLSSLNLRRIKASKPGGTWADWNSKLRAKCHIKKMGRGYSAVYGRMEWDKPAPTITTQAYGFGSGRFGHPTQHRALSLREAALLQSFPPSYVFVRNGERAQMKSLGRLIGNAVPVKLGRVIGRSINCHLQR